MYQPTRLLLLGALILFFGCDNKPAGIRDEDFIENLLLAHEDQFGEILSNPEAYKTQILYTRIDRDSLNRPSFKSYSYNLNERYFYPASTVKLPTVLLALEKLNELNIPHLDMHARMEIDSAYSGQSAVKYDSTSASNDPSIAHYIKKILMVSDNDAYNRLYEFIGQGELNRKLQAKGYRDSRIIHRLSIAMSMDENRHTNPMKFYDGDSLVYSQPMQVSMDSLNLKGEVLLGKGYIGNGKLVDEPMDFTIKNYTPIDEMQLVLRALMFPEYTPEKHRFDLTDEDYRFVYQYMSQYPRESVYPAYDSSYYDAYCKPLFFGADTAQAPEHIRSFNKIGQAYGFLIDNAYIVDFENGVEFLLTAMIQTNENEIYNDGVYEYDEVAFPFMKDLGQVIYQYELERAREFQPDLSRFELEYDR